MRAKIKGYSNWKCHEIVTIIFPSADLYSKCCFKRETGVEMPCRPGCIPNAGDKYNIVFRLTTPAYWVFLKISEYKFPQIVKLFEHKMFLFDGRLVSGAKHSLMKWNDDDDGSGKLVRNHIKPNIDGKWA